MRIHGGKNKLSVHQGLLQRLSFLILHWMCIDFLEKKQSKYLFIITLYINEFILTLTDFLLSICMILTKRAIDNGLPPLKFCPKGATLNLKRAFLYHCSFSLFIQGLHISEDVISNLRQLLTSSWLWCSKKQKDVFGEGVLIGVGRCLREGFKKKKKKN